MLFGEVLLGKCYPSGRGPPSYTADAKAEVAGGSTHLRMLQLGFKKFLELYY